MELNLDIPLKPINVNRLRMPFRNRLISTPEAREFKKQVKAYLKNMSQIRAFTDQWDNTMCLEVVYIFYIPVELYFKKDDTLSNRAGDVTNFIKGVQDAVMESINIDDRYIVDCRAIKLYAPSWSINIHMKIRTLDYVSFLKEEL